MLRLTLDPHPTPRPSAPILQERLALVCQQYAAQYRGEGGVGDGASMEPPIYVFRSALMHLARITRVLSMDQVRGHGRGGG